MGWKFEVTAHEDEDKINVDWLVNRSELNNRQLLGGESLGGFSVTVAQDDTAYEKGHWKVYLNTGQAIGYVGTLVAQGTAGIERNGSGGRPTYLCGLLSTERNVVQSTHPIVLVAPWRRDRRQLLLGGISGNYSKRRYGLRGDQD